MPFSSTTISPTSIGRTTSKSTTFTQTPLLASSTFSPIPYTSTPQKEYHPDGTIIFSNLNTVWIVDVKEETITKPISDIDHIYGLSATDGKGWIYFHSDRGSNHGILKLYRMMSDGSNIERLTYDDGYDDWVAISPDGNRVAYSSWLEPDEVIDNMSVVVIDYNKGGLVRRWARNNRLDQYLSWSPDSKKLAFIQEHKDNLLSGDLCIIELEVDEEICLVVGKPVHLDYASWSQDGQKIAVAIGEKDFTDIYTVDINTGELERITQINGAVYSPVWSPDGHSILYELGVGDDLKLMKLNLDNGETTVMVEGPWNDGFFHFRPVWSPDGQFFGYQRKISRDGSDFQIMSADGVYKDRLVTGLQSFGLKRFLWMHNNNEN